MVSHITALQYQPIMAEAFQTRDRMQARDRAIGCRQEIGLNRSLKNSLTYHLLFILSPKSTPAAPGWQLPQAMIMMQL